MHFFKIVILMLICIFGFNNHLLRAAELDDYLQQSAQESDRASRRFNNRVQSERMRKNPPSKAEDRVFEVDVGAEYTNYDEKPQQNQQTRPSPKIVEDDTLETELNDPLESHKRSPGSVPEKAIKKSTTK